MRGHSGKGKSMKTGVLLSILSIFMTALPLSAADPYSAMRQRMVEHDLKARGIRDGRVLKVMGEIPRHLFVDERYRSQAYADHPLPIEEGQTISQPYVVALMTETLKPGSSDRVLEIGTGSGYQAAVLAGIVREVYSVEIRKALSDRAAARLRALGYKNVTIKYADGYFGWPEHAPFDAIIVTCAANHIPAPLIKQLKEGGRLILPLGSTTYFQTLTLVAKKAGQTDVQHLTGVAFVPMTGEAQKK